MRLIVVQIWEQYDNSSFGPSMPGKSSHGIAVEALLPLSRPENVAVYPARAFPL